MALAGDAISGLQHFVNKRRCFPGAWRYFNAWSRAELPGRTPPLSPFVLLGVAGSFLENKCEEGAALVLLMFHCLLRTGEGLGVCTNHVTWTRAGLRGGLSLPLTKSGQRSGAPESVAFHDALVGSLLFAQVEKLPHGARLWRGTAAQFRDAWRFHLRRVHVDPEVFKPYALRRGGATAHFVEHNSLSATQYRGRWASVRACKIYVVEGQRELADAALTTATRQACAFYISVLRALAGPLIARIAGPQVARKLFEARPPP